MLQLNVDRPYYFGLDFVRFYAAFLVALFHFAVWPNAAIHSVITLVDERRISFLEPFAHFGAVGVEIFFVLSGLVIANSAAHTTAFEFLRGRVLRLYPAAWVCATLTLLAWLATTKFSADLVFRYMNSLTLWYRGPWIDAVYWTLAVEIKFYLLMFVVLLAGTFRHAAVLAWALLLASCCYIAAAMLQATMPLGSTFLYGAFFATGIFIWLSTTRKKVHSLI